MDLLYSHNSACIISQHPFWAQFIFFHCKSTFPWENLAWFMLPWLLFAEHCSCCTQRLLFSEMSLNMSTWVDFKTRGSCVAHLSPYNTDRSISISCCGRKLQSCCSAHQSQQFCCTASSALCVSNRLWAWVFKLPFLWLGALFEHQRQKKEWAEDITYTSS